MSNYKHITKLENYEKIALFVEYDDLVDAAIERVSNGYNEDKIDSHLIKEEFYKLISEMDEIIDVETFIRYQPIKQGDD